MVLKYMIYLMISKFIPEICVTLFFLNALIRMLQLENLYYILRINYEKKAGKKFSRYILDENNMIFIKPFNRKNNEKYFFIYSNILDEDDVIRDLKSRLRIKTQETCSSILLVIVAVILCLIYRFIYK